MLEPAGRPRAWYAVGAARWRWRAARGGADDRRRSAGSRSPRQPVALALAFLAAGTADELLRPDNWDELAAGIPRGIDALPGARVPYRGIDEWTRLVIPLGGTMLTVGGGADRVLAAPRRARLPARRADPARDALRGARRRARLRGRVPARRAAGAARARASCGSSGCGSPRPGPPPCSRRHRDRGADRRARARPRRAVVGLRDVGARPPPRTRPASPGTTTTARSTGRATAARCCA